MLPKVTAFLAAIRVVPNITRAAKAPSLKNWISRRVAVKAGPSTRKLLAPLLVFLLAVQVFAGRAHLRIIFWLYTGEALSAPLCRLAHGGG